MADIVGCISLAGSVLQLCYQYGTAVADSTGEAKRFTEELTALSGLLVAIQGITHDATMSGGVDATGVVAQCTKTLQDLKTHLQSHAPHMESRRLQRSFKRLTWPFKRDETIDMIQSIERQKKAVSMALDSYTIHFLGDQGMKIDGLVSSVHDIQNMLLEERKELRQQEILDWLTDLVQHSEHARLSQLRYENTCTWLSNTIEYKVWQASERSVLWYQGGSGTGKTMLASYIIDRESNLQQTKKEGALVYIYFDASMHHVMSLRTVIGSVLRQICQQIRIPEEIQASFNTSHSQSGFHERPSETVLRSLLEATLLNIPDLVLIVDAVDEAPSPDSVCKLLHSITDLPLRRCRIFMTSRPGMPSAAAMPKAINVTALPAGLRADIVEYINQRMANDDRLQRISLELKNKIRFMIVRGADGMIRWAQCLLDDISRLRTDRAIHSALQRLPKTLEETYGRATTMIEKDDLELAQQVLRWLCYALSPLDIRGLAEAVVLEPGITQIDDSIRLHNPRDVVDVVPTLVSCNELTMEVRLAHRSVREYLTSTSNITFSCTGPESNKIIAELCLTYLLTDSFTHGPLAKEKLLLAMKNYPLLSYAARWWPDHVKSSDAEIELLPLILRLMTPQLNLRYLFWLQVVFYFSFHGYTVPGIHGTGTSPDAIYYAASYGLKHTVINLVQNKANVNVRAGQFGGTPLHAACWRLHPRIIEHLVDAGADIEIRDFNGATPYSLLNFQDPQNPLLPRLAPQQSEGCGPCLRRNLICDQVRPVCGYCDVHGWWSACVKSRSGEKIEHEIIVESGNNLPEGLPPDDHSDGLSGHKGGDGDHNG